MPASDVARASRAAPAVVLGLGAVATPAVAAEIAAIEAGVSLQSRPRAPIVGSGRTRRLTKPEVPRTITVLRGCHTFTWAVKW